MKNAILECMARGEWYSRPAISDLSDVSKRQVIKLVDLLVADGSLVKRCAVHGEEFSLAVTESKNPLRPLTMRVPDPPAAYESEPTVAGAAYRPKWKRLKSYGAYALSHQRLCEEMR